MVLKPTEVFENSRDHSVLIIDNFREESAFWNGRELSDIRDTDLKRVFSVLKLQSQKVCRGLIGKQYVHGKFDDIDESSLLILVFENSRVFELRSKKIPWQRLRGFTACKVTRSKVIIDLVCATFPRLGTELINYVLRYADKYKKLNVHLDAATIELACKFYPRFGFKFTEKEKKARHDKRCKSEDGTVDSSGLPDSKMFKMLRTIKRNTMSQSQRSRAVASRTRAANTRKRTSEYRTPGTRRSKRKSRGTTTRYSGFETKLPHMRRNSSSSNSRLSNIPE